jgi:large subunit ribosomal protein L15
MVAMLKLNNLESSGKRRKRIGRGGSRGGTSGRGMGGQNARSGGGVGPQFEGGQMPLIRRLPKRGFSNARFTKEFEIVNLEQLNSRFDADATITVVELVAAGLVKGKKGKFVKVLGTGVLDKKLTVHAHAFSDTAREAIQKQGGAALVIEER